MEVNQIVVHEAWKVLTESVERVWDHLLVLSFELSLRLLVLKLKIAQSSRCLDIFGHLMTVFDESMYLIVCHESIRFMLISVSIFEKPDAKSI